MFMTAKSAKILFLTPGCFDKGGISRYSRYQIDALRQIMGPQNVRVVSLLGPDGDSFETSYEVDWHGQGGSATRGSRIGFAVQAIRQALFWRPDVIHCAHVNFTPLVTRLAKAIGARTVLNVYGLEIWSGLSPIRAQHMAAMDHIIADCHATGDYVTGNQMHAVSPTVIWDCADLDRFQPGPSDPELIAKYKLPDPETHRVVLTLGRLAVAARHKGYDRLIDIFSKVRARVPNAHLVFAGRGDDKKRLEARVVKAGLSDCVTFTGSVDEEDLAPIYNTAHVFALVSDMGHGRGEGIPLTPIEAMSAGLPILVGDQDGSHEAVDAGRNGIVVSPDDQQQMTDALVTLLSETGENRVARVTAARQVAEERFCATAFTNKHRVFYDAFLKKR